MHILRFPRLFLLLSSFAAAYLLYLLGAFDVFDADMAGDGYSTVFLGGLLLSFGFTAPFGLAILIVVAPDVSPWLGAIIGGTGAVLADVALFSFMRASLSEELRRLSATRFFLWLHSIFHHPSLSERARVLMLWWMGGLIIASPLPDEIGVILLSGSSFIGGRTFVIVCFLLNAAGIFAILSLAGGAA
jgi:hypothetical protein